MQDDRGYYYQLRTHYYLTHSSDYFHIRDKQEWNQQLSCGEGKVFLPDLKIYTLRIEALRALGVLQLLEPGRTFSENDADLILLKNTVLQCSKHIQRALNINLAVENEQVSTIKIIRRLFNLLGLKLKQVNNVYRIDRQTLNDGREEIFDLWCQRDELMLTHLKNVADSQVKGQRLEVKG